MKKSQARRKKTIAEYGAEQATGRFYRGNAAAQTIGAGELKRVYDGPDEDHAIRELTRRERVAMQDRITVGGCGNRVAMIHRYPSPPNDKTRLLAKRELDAALRLPTKRLRQVAATLAVDLANMQTAVARTQADAQETTENLRTQNGKLRRTLSTLSDAIGLLSNIKSELGI